MKNYLALLLVIIAFQAHAETGIAPDSQAAQRGLQLYSNNCEACHRTEGVGEVIPWGVRHPDYLTAMPLNDTSHAWHHGDEQLVQMIQRGNQRMPKFGQILSAPQISDLVAYIKSLWSERLLACQGPKHMSCM